MKRAPKKSLILPSKLSLAGLTLALASLQAACGNLDDLKNKRETVATGASSDAELTNLDSGLEELSFALNGMDEDFPEFSEELASTDPQSTQGQDSEAQGSVSRNCVDDPAAGKTTVTVVRTKQAHVNRRWLSGAEAAAGGTITSETTRVWSRNGASVGCHESGEWALIQPRDMDGVTLEIAFKRTVEGNTSVTRAKANDGKARVGAYEAEGTRFLSYAQTFDGTSLVYSVQLESHEIRAALVSNDEQSKAGGLEIKTAKEPLVITIKRDPESLELQSRTIESGTTLTTRGNGASLISTFDKVVYERGDQCVGPVSGAITSLHTGPGGKERTLELSFAPGSTTITVSKDGEQLHTLNRTRPCSL